MRYFPGSARRHERILANRNARQGGGDPNDISGFIITMLLLLFWALGHC